MELEAVPRADAAPSAPATRMWKCGQCGRVTSRALLLLVTNRSGRGPAVRLYPLDLTCDPVEPVFAQVWSDVVPDREAWRAWLALHEHAPWMDPASFASLQDAGSCVYP